MPTGDGGNPAGSHFPGALRHFIDSCHWKFAETYAETWPHEYIVRKNVDDSLFVRLVCHIREHGYEGRLYRMPASDAWFCQPQWH